jgi:hypothetical protein
MRRATHENLMELKGRTGHSLSLWVEIGLIALSTAAAKQLGENCGAGLDEIDRVFSEIERARVRLERKGDLLNARALRHLDIHFNNEIDEAPQLLVDFARSLKESESFSNMLAKLTPDEFEAIIQAFKERLADAHADEGPKS